MHFTIAFISAAGISLTAGLTTSQKSLADISETVLNRSDTSFALLDSTKFGTTALIPLAKQAKVTSIITDDSLSASEIMKYREAGWPISTPSGGK
jgi:DeoR/GlpR family transcriptional regulator of sugar metabolism